MKLRSDQLYNEMQHDLSHCRDKGFLLQVETECCFRISEKYWQLLRDDIRKFGFTSLTDEIFFFKEIKPKFIAELEYFRLINYAANFCPDDTFPHDQKNFWTRQMNRLDKFKAQNEQFWIYYSSGQVSKDEIYFIRGDKDDDEYSFDKTASNFDELTGQLLARQRYNVYAREKLRSCLESR